MSTDQPQSSDQYAIRITVTGPTDPPEGVTSVRHVGPYTHHWQADDAMRVFRHLADDRLVESEPGFDVRMELVPFEPTRRPPLDPCPPKDVEPLADLITANPPGDLWHFPTLRDRLLAAHGPVQTTWSWTAALRYAAGLAADGEQERRAAEESDPRLAPCRAAVLAASQARIEHFATKAISDATELLADVLDAAKAYGVDREEAARQFAPVALDVVAARTVVPA